MKQIDFRNGSLVRNIVRSSVPMLAAQVLSLVYSIVDRFFIGRIPGESQAALAGIGLCFPIVILVTAFTNLFGMGGAPLFSIEFGKGNKEKADQIMNTAFYALLFTAAGIFAVCELAAAPLLTLFGASEVTLGYALAYLRIYLLGTVFTMIASGLNPYINAQGFAGMGMITVAAGAVANLVLDPLFIFGLGMGIRGAAVATVLSQALSAFLVLHFLRRGRAQMKLRHMGLREIFDCRGIAADIAGLGMASFIMQFTNSLVNIVCNHMLSVLGGDIYVTIMTVVSSVRQVLEVPMYAMGEGTSPILSFNYGARRPKMVRQAIFILIGIEVVYTALIRGFIEAQPSALIRIFSSEPDVIKNGVPALHIYFYAFVFQALQYTAQTIFKALNKKKRAIFFSLLRKVILVIPLTILLPRFGMGIDGVFMAEPISNLLGGLASFITMLVTILPELGRMQSRRGREDQVSGNVKK